MSEVIKKEKDPGILLGDRMKKFEDITRSYLIQKMPVIIRVDGRAFHSYTKQKWCDFPYSFILINTFHKTVLKVCEKTMNIVLAYHQSDEVSFLLKDYDRRNQQQLFDGNIQKIVSTFASKFTYWFNKFITEELKCSDYDTSNLSSAEFDTRVFNIPLHDVTNYFIWRQKDWQRNSLTQYASSFFSHKELENKNGLQKVEMIAEIKEKPWIELHNCLTKGTFFKKVEVDIPLRELSDIEIKHLYNPESPIGEISDYVVRKKWIIDYNSPNIVNDKEYIENIVQFTNEENN